MAELNIKKEIGKRILEARKEKGFTLKTLGELAGGLKQTRLTNWEQGVRSPGPEEIKQLAQALEVSPAYLMCLSDEKQFTESKNPSQLIPLLDYRQAGELKFYMDSIYKNSENVTFISISTALLPKLSMDLFALKVANDSMMPEMRVHDVLVVDPNVLPKPGDFVVFKIVSQAEAIICQYKKLSYASLDFELITLNDNWPNIKASDGEQIEVMGVVVQNIRRYK